MKLSLPAGAPNFDIVLVMKDSKTVLLDLSMSLSEVRMHFWDGEGDFVLFYQCSAAVQASAAASSK